MGFFILLGLIVLGVIIVWISRVLARWLKRPRLRYLFYFIGFALLFGDIPLAHLQLYYLCHLQPIDEKIDNTKPLDAYVFNAGPGCDENCQKALIKYKIKTVEIPIKNPNPKLWTTQEGWHHFYLSQKDDPNCKLFEENPVLAEGYNLPDNACIASKIVKGEPIFGTWGKMVSEQTAKRSLFPYTEVKLIRREKTTNEVIFVHYNFLLESGSWLDDFLNEYILGTGGKRVSCPGPTITRYPDL